MNGNTRECFEPMPRGRGKQGRLTGVTVGARRLLNSFTTARPSSPFPSMLPPRTSHNNKSPRHASTSGEPPVIARFTITAFENISNSQPIKHLCS